MDFEILSCTDLKCYWRKEKVQALKDYEPEPMCDEASTSTVASNIAKYNNITVTDEDKQRMLENYCHAAPQSAVAKHRNTTSDPVHEHIYCKIIENINNSPFLKSCNLLVDCPLRECCQKILDNLGNVNYKAATNIKQNTKEWLNLRQLRITGSRCYEIYTYAQDDWKNKALRYFWPKSFDNKYTRHGKMEEPNALARYLQKNPGIEVHTLGLLISKNFPWLGYSPDGIAFENGVPTKLIEIKCPFAGKYHNEEELVLNFCNYLNNDGGVITLKKRHAYYNQVLYGMALLNIPKTDFLIYSSLSKNYVALTVNFNPVEAKELLEKVTRNYFNFMIHVYC